MRRFSDAFDREQAERETSAAIGAAHYVEAPSKATFDLDAAVAHGVAVATAAGLAAGAQGGQLAHNVAIATAMGLAQQQASALVAV